MPITHGKHKGTASLVIHTTCLERWFNQPSTVNESRGDGRKRMGENGRCCKDRQRTRSKLVALPAKPA